MAAPHAVMVAVFLDDCTAVNAPLLIVPESQAHGLVDTASRDREAALAPGGGPCVASEARPVAAIYLECGVSSEIIAWVSLPCQLQIT